MTEASEAPTGMVAQPAPGPLTAPGSMRLEDVSLLTQADTGPIEVAGLSLIFDQAGMSVRKRSGDLVKVLPWNALVDITLEDRRLTPVDPAAASMLVETDRRTHQFRVRGQDAEPIAEELSALAKRYVGGHGLVTAGGIDIGELMPWLVCAGMILLAVLLVLVHLAGHLAVY